MNQENSQPNEKKHNYFYKITNLINGKYYYGIRSTDKEIEKDKYFGSGDAIKKAIKKYGKKNFKKEIIADYPTRKEASDNEREIVTFDLIQLEECYNCRTGGIDGYIRIVSVEERQKLSNALTGMKRSNETKRKISDALKLYLIKHPEKRNRLGQLALGGKLVSELTREKMRENRKRQIITKESRIKAVETKRNNGKPWHSDEAKIKMGEKNWLKKIKGSPEASNKMRKLARKTPCIIEGFEFESVKFASRIYLITEAILTRRLKSKKEIWKNWIYT